jgi:cytochrome c-type biogenesis protein CcmH
MIEQMLENLSIASLPVIAGTILCGISLTGLMLWIIKRGRAHLPGGDQTSQVCQLIDLLQNERQHRDSEQRNGIISAEEYASACLEIDRRLLALTSHLDQQKHESQSMLTPRIIMLSLLVPALSTFIYLCLGSPQSPDQPIASRSAEIATAKAGANKNQNEAAATLQKAISSTEQMPQNVETWLLLAQAAGAVNDSETEIRALRTAIEITESDPSIMAMLAEALSRAADGQITVPARAIIKTVLEANPNEPRAMFLAGLAAFQDGDNERAIRLWQNLLAKSQPDAPWISTVRDNIKSAAETGNIPLDPLNTAEPTGPDASVLADAATMTEDEQNEMISGMVQRLRDRLVEEPNDTDGWMRLARAYNVLGQTENALDALANGEEFAPENLDLKLALLEQILNMGNTKAEIERAKLVLAKGEKIAPLNPQILFFKGYLAQLSGNIDQARTAWHKLKDILDPKSNAAEALKAEIEKLPKSKN